MTFERHGVGSVALAFSFAVAWQSVQACSVSGSGGSAAVGADAGGSDATVAEPDAGAPPDAPIVGSGDASSACSPANVAGYVPNWTPPKAPASVCTQAELTSYAACLDAADASSAACAPWAATATDAGASAACRACVADSKATDDAWGPIVDVGSSGSDRQLNVSGCLAIVLHDTGSGCSGTLQALEECESAACADNCAVASSASLAACVAASDLGGCSNYVAPSACVYEAGASAAACLGTGSASATFGEKFAAIAAVFCLEVDAGP
jgi:hypothetical protein